MSIARLTGPVPIPRAQCFPGEPPLQAAHVCQSIAEPVKGHHLDPFAGRKCFMAPQRPYGRAQAKPPPDPGPGRLKPAPGLIEKNPYASPHLPGRLVDQYKRHNLVWAITQVLTGIFLAKSRLTTLYCFLSAQVYHRLMAETTSCGAEVVLICGQRQSVKGNVSSQVQVWARAEHGFFSKQIGTVHDENLWIKRNRH